MHAFDFLDDACVASVTVAYNSFIEREGQIHKPLMCPLTPSIRRRRILSGSGDRLTLADLDPGFRVPESFAEWCNGHKPNIRPVDWGR